MADHIPLTDRHDSPDGLQIGRRATEDKDVAIVYLDLVRCPLDQVQYATGVACI